MRIKGDNIKENGKLIAGRLYKIWANRTIQFEEEETADIVNINFSIAENQYGIYGNEYKPPFIEDNGGKKADILAFVIDEGKEKFSSWVLDVKKAVGGEDVIYHLIEQLTESLKHKKSITTYLDDFVEEQHVGYITRDLQRDRIQETISKKSTYLSKEQENLECMPTLIKTQAQRKLLKEQVKLGLLCDFQNNCMKMGKDIIPLESYISQEKDGKFVYELNVASS